MACLATAKCIHRVDSLDCANRDAAVRDCVTEGRLRGFTNQLPQRSTVRPGPTNASQQHVASVAISGHPLANRDPGLLGTRVRDMEIAH